MKVSEVSFEERWKRTKCLRYWTHGRRGE